MISALEMRVQLKRLMQRHQIAAPALVNIPLTAPTVGAMVVTGLASTTTLDLERTKVRRRAFYWGKHFPPLLYRHDPDQVAGEILALDYDAQGQLRIRARVDHVEARRCGAFSVSMNVEDYEFRDVDDKSFHAFIKRATLTEVSLTQTPANANALVTSRWLAPPQTPPTNQFYSLMQAKVTCLTKLVPLLALAVPERDQPPPPTSFRQLVAAINAKGA